MDFCLFCFYFFLYINILKKSLFFFEKKKKGLLLIGDIVRLLPHRVKFRHHHWQPISLQRARCLIAGKVQPRARISTRWRLLPALFALNDNTPYVNQIGNETKNQKKKCKNLNCVCLYS